MSDWFSGEELLDNWKIKIFELVDRATKGLQPYDEFRKKIPPPNILAKKERLENLKRKLKSQKLFIKQPSNIKKNRLIDRRRRDGIDENELLKEIKKEIKKIKKGLPKEDINSWINYKPSDSSDSKKEVLNVYEIIRKSFFKVADVNLFERINSLEHKIDQKVLHLIHKIKPEIEILYSAVRRDSLKNAPPNADEDWKKKALKEFDRNRQSFKIIKRDDLDDKDIYPFSPGKERRDFIGRVLKKIVKRHQLGSYGAQKLAKLYNLLPPNPPTNH